MDRLTERLEQAIARADDSLAYKAAVQARRAIRRSREEWGERGVPFELRSEGAPGEEEWVWLGEVIARACQERLDLTVDPELLSFQVREVTPVDAATRLDRFRVALEAEGKERPLRWLTPSGDPYLARPAEMLLTHAFRGWEADLLERLRSATGGARGALAQRTGRWSRKMYNRMVQQLNQDRVDLFIRLITAAYAPDGNFSDRLRTLSAEDRLQVYRAIADQRGHLIVPDDLAPFLEDRVTQPQALDILSRASASSGPSDHAAG